MKRIKESEKNAWVKWLKVYGPKNFLNHFLKNVENAQSTCKHCGRAIHVDIMVGGGVADWSTEDGDFGCTSHKGDGSHMPIKWRNNNE